MRVCASVCVSVCMCVSACERVVSECFCWLMRVGGAKAYLSKAEREGLECLDIASGEASRRANLYLPEDSPCDAGALGEGHCHGLGRPRCASEGGLVGLDVRNPPHARRNSRRAKGAPAPVREGWWAWM